MSSAQIFIEEKIHAELMPHLIPRDHTHEHAIFVFAQGRRYEIGCVFEFIESHFVLPNEFYHQRGDYLELSDRTRAWVIKRAHDLDASIIKFHSHLGQWSAQFFLRTALD